MSAKDMTGKVCPAQPPPNEAAGFSRVRRALRILSKSTAIAVALSLSAPAPVSAFDLFGKSDEAETADIADPLFYTASFSGPGLSEDDEAALRDASALLADAEKPVSGSLGLITKATSDRDNLVGKLYEQARYGGLVEIRINGTPLESIEPTTTFTGKPQVSIRIEGGEVFRFGRVEVRSDDGSMPPQQAQEIVSEQPAYSTAILAEQDRLVSQMKAEGYPYAEMADSIVEADHNSKQLDVTLVVHAGPMADMGLTTVSGAQDVDPEFIREQAGIEPGRPYSPEALAEAEKRLRDLEVFDSVAVREGDTLDENGRVPIEVEVQERKQRYFGVGATYSNADGAGIEGYWGHRNLFGRAEKLRVEGSVSRIGEADSFENLNYSTAILFEKPAFYGIKNTFTANLRGVQEFTDAYKRRSLRGGFGVRREIDKRQTLTAALDMDWSRITEPGKESEHLIASVPLEYSYDASDNKLDPSEGYRFSALLEPATDLAGSASFVKARVTASAYYTPEAADNVTLAARASVGSIMGADRSAIPADRRFYAGGGGSIRGFAYQAVGPKNAAGKPTGGLSVVEASLEARIKVADKFGIVPFVDFGNVGTSSTPDFTDLRMGAGVGIRYVTPFGPLRLDVGVPINRRKGEDSWAIYAGIGQAF